MPSFQMPLVLIPSLRVRVFICSSPNVYVPDCVVSPSRPRMYDKPYGSTADPAPPPLSYPQQLLNTFSVKSSLENKSSFGFSTVNDLSPSAQIQ